jgi:hypothetical protein
MVVLATPSSRDFKNGCRFLSKGPVAEKPHPTGNVRGCPQFLLTVQGGTVFSAGRLGRKFEMFEMVAAVMALLGAGIFLAHAFEGTRWAYNGPFAARSGARSIWRWE